MPEPRIKRDPKVMMGKPVIKGTRITVELVLRECAGGRTASEVALLFPGLSEGDVGAAIAYAQDGANSFR